MYSNSAWHAEGLRWIASLFLGAAEYLERMSRAASPCEQPHIESLPVEDFIDNVRFRIQSRYF